MMQYEPSKTVVEAVRGWLGKEGILLFQGYQQKYGTVSPCMPSEFCGGIPHPVHFREGMQVRNFLRSLKECSAWTDHDFDNRWIPVVEKAVEDPNATN